jgi:hypothetical protein
MVGLSRAAPNPAVAEYQPPLFGGWVVHRHSGSVASKREKLINIDAKVVSYSQITFHMAGVGASLQMFPDIPMLVPRLLSPPA